MLEEVEVHQGEEEAHLEGEGEEGEEVVVP